MQCLKSHLYYRSLVWAQTIYSIKKHFVLRKKSIQLVYIMKRNEHTTLLFEKLIVLGLLRKTATQNSLFY